jgi:hypothetical protein
VASRLRKRKWTKKVKDVAPLDYVWKIMRKAVPWFKDTQIAVDRGSKHRTASGRYPGRGTHVADWELDVWAAHDDPTDVIVKMTLWRAKGGQVGESYRVSIVRADRVAGKLAQWVDKHIREMKRRRR